MPQSATLEFNSETTEVIVKEALLKEEYTRLRGADPINFPNEVSEHIDFRAENQTAVIPSESPVSVTNVRPTTKPVSTPPITPQK